MAKRKPKMPAAKRVKRDPLPPVIKVGRPPMPRFSEGWERPSFPEQVGRALIHKEGAPITSFDAGPINKMRRNLAHAKLAVEAALELLDTMEGK